MLTPERLEAIRRFDTCTIADAIECFDVRLRNEGFTRPGLGPVTGPDDRILGYAATFRVKSSGPPVTGGRFVDRTDWWSAIERLPRPRVAVFERLKDDGGEGSCIGEVHGAILKAFGCEGVISDGSVRDVPGLRRLGLPVFAKSVTVSHSFTHLVDFGVPVEIFGLAIGPGDLLYADCHGVLAIPIGIAAELPEVAERISRKDRRIIDSCQAPDFSPEKLLKALRENEQTG
ncbi:MAG: RraA family protein [Thermoanaerobaculaceae bacterium]